VVGLTGELSVCAGPDGSRTPPLRPPSSATASSWHARQQRGGERSALARSFHSRHPVLVDDDALGNKGAPTVLVADADRAYRDALTIALEREGYQVATATNATRTVAERTRAQPSLILLDASLADAYAAMDNATSQPRTPTIVVGTPSRALATDGLADAFVAKPFRLRDLLRLVRRLIPDDGPDEVTGDRRPRVPRPPDPGITRATLDYGATST
jgi:CheY-like chemotaxis protein